MEIEGGVMPDSQQGVTNLSMQEDRWERVKHRFEHEFGGKAFQTWLKPLSFSTMEAGTVELAAPTNFIRDWIQRHYARRLKEFFVEEDVSVRDLKIRIARPSEIKANKEKADADKKNAAPIAVSGEQKMSGAPTLDPRYTFDSFVVGKSNELAFAAAQRVAESGEVTFNPLFLHGGVGLGKTHLMHAIAWDVKRRHPDKKVLYLSAEKFMFQFISALRYKDTMAFKQQFRNVDLLMIDDVQFIGNKNSTQEEFFHTFNALVDNRRQVVISADRSPTDLEGIEDRIISRLGWGLVADIHPTDYELRLGILQSKSDAHDNVNVPVEVLEFLARRITSNVRELEGAFNRVVAYATLVGRPITLDMTREVLQDLIRANDRKVTIDEIQRTVASYFNIRISEMLSPRRARAIARPRQVAMYLAKQLTSRSLPEIGRKFSRDHSTVIHAVDKIQDLMKDDSQLNEDITHLSRQLEG